MGKRTPLYDEHVCLGATIVPFAGWDMPVYYTSVIDEHRATREAAGLFDTCHMGEIEVSGPDSFAFIQSLISNDMNKLEPRKIIYAALTNEHGGCVDDVTVYMFSKVDFCVVVNASNIQKDFDWIVSRKGDFDVLIIDRSEATAMLALQGPATLKTLAKLCDDPPPERFYFSVMMVAGAKAIVSRTSYTGEDGVELYFEASVAPIVWNGLLEAGAPFGLKPVGLGARDTLRLEACYSLYGHELTDDISPVEAGISFAVAPGKTFPGSDAIYAQLKNGPARKLAAFELTVRGVPREHYPVFVGDASAGTVTSGCFSPTFNKGLGLALLKSEFTKIGTEIAVEIRGKKYAGRVVKRPFLNNTGGK